MSPSIALAIVIVITLGIAAYLIGSMIWSIQKERRSSGVRNDRGSAESKDGDERMEATLKRIEKRLEEAVPGGLALDASGRAE
ncbi:MAG: hypothetical protein ACRDGU_05805 [Actinomycetota bacterium]